MGSRVHEFKGSRVQIVGVVGQTENRHRLTGGNMCVNPPRMYVIRLTCGTGGGFPRRQRAASA
eukprot:1593999-Pyramimonas_sp.AAC.1